MVIRRWCRECRGTGFDDDHDLCPWCKGSGEDDLTLPPDDEVIGVPI